MRTIPSAVLTTGPRVNRSSSEVKRTATPPRGDQSGVWIVPNSAAGGSFARCSGISRTMEDKGSCCRDSQGTGKLVVFCEIGAMEGIAWLQLIQRSMNTQIHMRPHFVSLNEFTPRKYTEVFLRYT